MLLAAVQARVAAVPALAGRVHGAAALAQLTERGQLAQAGRVAFVVPAGIGGSEPTAGAGLFRQPVTRLVGVFLAIRNVADATGGAGFTELEPLIEDVIAAVAGWAPEEATGVFRLARGELVSIVAGTITYQLDFVLDDQLRIIPG